MADLERPYALRDFVGVLHTERGIERSYETLYRWATKGWRNGKRLACTSVSGVLHTSLKSFDQLVEEPALR